MRIHHVNLVVPTGLAEATAEFWSSVFDLQQMPRQGLSGRPGAWLHCSEFEIHISERETLAHHDAHLALSVPDVATIASRCISGGHPWEEAPALFGTGRGFTRDPGGNRVEVVQELESTLAHQLGQ